MSSSSLSSVYKITKAHIFGVRVRWIQIVFNVFAIVRARMDDVYVNWNISY